jgi:hypothetical protein
MKSLDTLLAEAVKKMKPATLKKFHERTRGEKLPQESLISVAESLVAEDGEDAREPGRPIRRNNGGSRQPSEAEDRRGLMQEADRVLFEGMEAARSTAKGIADFVEVDGEYRRKPDGADQLTESQREDLAFCRMLHMSESDAMRVVTSKGSIRD